MEALVEHGWMEDGKGPDIIAGTSIGAINAAALASGLTIAQIKDRWMDMHTEDVHRLSSNIPAVARPFMKFVLHSVLTSKAHGGTTYDLPEEDRNMNASTLLERLGMVFKRPFQSLLDTTPWRYTLDQWMNFDRINNDPAAPALLLTATDIRRGTLRVFCNRPIKNHPPDTIRLDHLMASSSIPAVYPWTTIDDTIYWDGAVLANTPLGGVIDLAGSDDVDILVVMMTPWCEDQHPMDEGLMSEPKDIVESLSLTLDWAMLASYRMALKLMKNYNDLVDAAEKLDRAAEQTGDESLRMTRRGLRRMLLPTVIAPASFMPLDQIIDYEEEGHRKLFRQGREDALAALRQRETKQ
jgi:NTE family protein